MNRRTYNPLTEGYRGHSDTTEKWSTEGYNAKARERGYTGTDLVSSAPKIIPSIQSAVVKPNNAEKLKTD